MAFREGGEHGEAVAVDDVELFAIPIDVAFGQDFGEFVEVFGVLRADMGESMAALVVIGGVPGVAQIEIEDLDAYEKSVAARVRK